MKVLIGYDGSESGDAIFDDLKRAGLPREGDARIISVADLSVAPPPVSEFDMMSAASRRLETALRQAGAHRERVIGEARVTAEEAADRVRSELPEWRVDMVAGEGTPAWEIIDAASVWDADLIIVGSQGRSALGRFLLGSVSKRIATDARSSVRIARSSSPDENRRRTRIIVGVDGSPAAEEAIYAVGRRPWRDGTEVRLVAVDDSTPVTQIASRLPQAAAMVNSYFQSKGERVSSMLEWANEQLNGVGLSSSVIRAKGDARRILLEEADKWHADGIFVGTRDLKGVIERFRLGSVSTAVATNAHCSVEIVRPAVDN